MKVLGLDRFTLGIAIGAVVLVPLLLVLVLVQPRAAPMDEASPAGVVHNYYLAVTQNDLTTAYGYLSTDTRGWFSYEQFAAQHNGPLETRNVRIQSERFEGETARVSVGVTTYRPTGWLSNGEVTNQRNVVLRQDAGAWRIALPRPPDGAPYSGYLVSELYGW